jgi:hypothetical protein
MSHGTRHISHVTRHTSHPSTSHTAPQELFSLGRCIALIVPGLCAVLFFDLSTDFSFSFDQNFPKPLSPHQLYNPCVSIAALCFPSLTFFDTSLHVVQRVGSSCWQLWRRALLQRQTVALHVSVKTDWSSCCPDDA